MKKSSLFIILLIGIYLVTITVTNAKLKHEYAKGNYSNTIIKKVLPSFSYIKEDIDLDVAENYPCELKLFQEDTTYVQFDSTKMPELNFTVKNDTLYITQNEETTIEHGYFFQLAAPHLHSVSLSRSNFIIDQWEGDSLAFITKNNVQLYLHWLHVNSLTFEAKNRSIINLNSSGPADTIPMLHLFLKDNSSFKADNIFVKNRSLELGEFTTFQLTGRTAANFGLK